MTVLSNLKHHNDFSPVPAIQYDTGRKVIITDKCYSLFICNC